MNRRSFLLLGLFLLLSTAATAQEEEPAARPNIVIVMADDLGWSDVGCYGGEIPTPAIDSLAKEGLRFRRFYNNAICGPTRASLLTGLYCQQIGHRGDRWNEPKDFSKCVTIGEVLQAEGYRTMMVGKWQGRDSALDRGFDRFFGPMCQAKISYFHEVKDNPYFLDRKRLQPGEDFYLTDAINDHASQFLSEAIEGDEPFFLYVAHIAPHWPLHAREEEIAKFRKHYLDAGWDECRRLRIERQRELGAISEQHKAAPLPAGVRDWKSESRKEWQAERMAVYAAQVAAVDRGLAALLEKLEAAGEADNTLVMFLSDNGAAPDGGLSPTSSGFGFSAGGKNDTWRLDGVFIKPGSGPDNMPGPHDTFAAYGLAWASMSNTPLRGTKQTGYEGGIRTPLIACWPAVIRERGGWTPQPGHVIDFMATCLDAAGAAYPREFQGRKPLPLEGKSLLPIFRGEQRSGHESLCFSVPRHDVILTADWKAIRDKGKDDWQLYDLQSDGGETADSAAWNQSRVEAMAKQFEAWRTRVGAN